MADEITPPESVEADSKLIISWSGTASEKVAKGFYDWIGDVIESVDPW